MYYRMIPRFLIVVPILLLFTSLQLKAQDERYTVTNEVTGISITASDDPFGVGLDCGSGELVIEDFEDTLIKTGNLLACDTPLRSQTNDECFYLGTIADGIAYSTFHVILLEAYGVVTPKNLGLTNVGICAHFPEEYSRFTFSVPTELVQFDVFDVVGTPGQVWIRPYDELGNLLAETYVQLNTPDSPTTITVSSPDSNIARVDVVDKTFYTWEFFYNVGFCRMMPENNFRF